jgi:hypothetical protein
MFTMRIWCCIKYPSSSIIALTYHFPCSLCPLDSSLSAGNEVKLLLARPKAMTPRTYRLGEGYTLFLGGLVRIDLLELPQATIYLTVWASDLLPLHAGRTKSADEMYARHVGTFLYPPSGESVAQNPAELVPTPVCSPQTVWPQRMVP